MTNKLKKKVFKVGDDVIPLGAKNLLARCSQDGNVAILKMDEDSYFYQIDKIAAKIWLLIDGRRSVRQIKAAIRSRQEVPSLKFERDVGRFLQALKREGLVDFK